jgi:hypothetical protein
MHINARPSSLADPVHETATEEAMAGVVDVGVPRAAPPLRQPG